MDGINYIEHHGIKGQKWYVRRFQNEDGSLTALGRARLGYSARKEAKRSQKLKQRLLSNPKKLSKNLDKVSAKDLRAALEKAELAEQLKNAERTAKIDERASKQAQKEEKVKNRLALERAKAETEKIKAEIKEKKEKKKQDKIEAKQKTKDKATTEEIKAKKWENKGKKWKGRVETAKQLKTILDDMGITKPEAGKTVIGGLFAYLGLKQMPTAEETSKTKEKETKKKKDQAEAVAKMFGANKSETKDFVDKVVEKHSDIVSEATKSVMDDAKDIPIHHVINEKKNFNSPLNTFKLDDAAKTIGTIATKSSIQEKPKANISGFSSSLPKMAYNSPTGPTPLNTFKLDDTAKTLGTIATKSSIQEKPKANISGFSSSLPKMAYNSPTGLTINNAAINKVMSSVSLKEVANPKWSSNSFSFSSAFKNPDFITLGNGQVIPLLSSGFGTSAYQSNSDYNFDFKFAKGGFTTIPKTKSGAYDKRYKESKWSEDFKNNTFSHSGFTFSEMLDLLEAGEEEC